MRHKTDAAHADAAHAEADTLRRTAAQSCSQIAARKFARPAGATEKTIAQIMATRAFKQLGDAAEEAWQAFQVELFQNEQAGDQMVL